MKRASIIFGLVLATFVTGCGVPAPSMKAGPDMSQSPPGSAATLPDAAREQNDFGFDLARRVLDPERNGAISPNSIAAVLAMIEAGANGSTKQEILDALHISGPDAARIGVLQRELATRNRDGVKLSSADRAWLDDQLQLLASYTERLQRDFDAPIGRLDLDDTDAAAATINRWVSEQTHGKIKKLVTPDMLDLSVLVLTNAVYLDAKWEHPFLHEDTSSRPFHRAPTARQQTCRR